jgi:hypothetical protein
MPMPGAATTFSFNVLYILLALGWAWLVVVLGVEWSDNFERLHLRLEEAHLLSSTFCNSTRGARLAKEYALCDEAEVMVKSKNLWGKAFEKTIRSVALRAIHATGEVSLAALGNVAAAAAAAAVVGVLCNSLTQIVNGNGRAIDTMSPMARARLDAIVDIDMRGLNNLHLE